MGTKEFGEAIVKRLGQLPQNLKPVKYQTGKTEEWPHHGTSFISTKRELVGVDIFLYSHDAADTLRQKLQGLNSPSLKLTMISNRGVKVWPGGIPETFCIDHWRCRYEGQGPLKYQRIAAFLHELADAGFDIIQTENLYTYDGKPGYSGVEA